MRVLRNSNKVYKVYTFIEAVVKLFINYSD